MVSGELERFSLGFSDFSNIRRLPGLAYFDKTEYIPVLEKGVTCSARLPAQAIWKVAHRLCTAILPWMPVPQPIRPAFQGVWPSVQDLRAHITYAELGSRRG